MEKTTKNEEIRYTGIQNGETFQLAGIEFIKFPSKDGQTVIMAKDSVFRSTFGKSNDLRSSNVRKKLEKDILPQIIDAIGEENLCTVNTDLTTLDGLKTYGVMESLISIPTLDFYRENVEIFDKHNIREAFWLATPESAKPHCDSVWVLCVWPSGFVNLINYDLDFAVRPVLILKSSIFESSEV